MHIGTTVGLQLAGPQSLDDVVDEVRHVADLGLTDAWWSQNLGWDALSAIAVAGGLVPGIGLGTAVVPTSPRHPLALASQALTVQAAVGGRLTLGVGPSHAPIIEGAFGLPFDRPAAHTREYLSALVPLLRGEAVDVRGEQLRVAGQITVPHVPAPTVLLAALGPTMLRIAGELTDGTIATWTGVRTLSEHIVPRIGAAASAAGRPAPRVLVSVPVGVTDDPDGTRAWAAERFGAADGPAELPGDARSRGRGLVDRPRHRGRRAHRRARAAPPGRRGCHRAHPGADRRPCTGRAHAGPAGHARCSRSRLARPEPEARSSGRRDDHGGLHRVATVRLVHGQQRTGAVDARPTGRHPSPPARRDRAPRPFRTSAARSSSTRARPRPRSASTGGSSRSGARASSATASSIPNGPTASRRSARRWAPPPSAVPTSAASERM